MAWYGTRSGTRNFEQLLIKTRILVTQRKPFSHEGEAGMITEKKKPEENHIEEGLER